MLHRPEPFRGEVWDVEFADFGTHPAVIVSVNAMNIRLGHVAVVPVTGTSGPPATHIQLDADAGLTRYDVSFVDITGLQPVDRRALLRLRGRLSSAELGRIAEQLSVYLGLPG